MKQDTTPDMPDGQGLIGSIRYKALFVVLVAMLATGFVVAIDMIAPRLADQILLNDTRRRAVLWERRVLGALTWGADTFRRGTLTPSDEARLAQVTGLSDVYRLKLFNAQGQIIWSSRPKEIGEFADNDAFRMIVTKGQIAASLNLKPPSEIDRPTLHSVDAAPADLRHVAEVYSPVQTDDGFIGAVEFYSDISDLRSSFVTRTRSIMILLEAVAGLFMVLVIGYVLRSGRRSVLQMKQIADKEHRALTEQRRLSNEVKMLGELNEWLQSSSTLDELFRIVARFMTHLIPAAEGSIYVYSNSRDVLDGGAAWNGGTLRDHIRPDECWGLRRGQTYGYGSNAVNFLCDHSDHVDERPYYCFPLLAHGETVGLMTLRSHSASGDAVLADGLRLAQICAEQISVAIANVRMRDALQDQAIRDPLTGLFNRRHMNTHLRNSLKHCTQKGEPLSVVAVDVDHFKKFNDTHGHDAGDMVLAAVGKVMRKICDGNEIAARPGGEEFTLILPGSDASAAVRRAEALREAVEQIRVHYGQETLPRVTLSLGVVTYPEDGTTPQDLLTTADAALYRAKAMGRNQVCRRDGAGPQAEDATVPNRVPALAVLTETNQAQG